MGVRVEGAAKVLSIVGPGRSGTTVLGEILGEVDGVFDAGEVRWLWRRGLLEGRRCGCGVPVPVCPVWSDVLSRVSAERSSPSPQVTGQLMSDLQVELGRRRRRLAVLAASDPGSTASSAMCRYTAVMTSVFHAVRQVSGAAVTVDTSKRAVDAAVANRGLGHDHYLVHIVRDPRAVAYSWQRLKMNPSSDESPVLSRRTALASAVRWVENAISAQALRRRIPPQRQVFLRYEDFARQPASTIMDILSLVGVDPQSCPVAEDGTVRLSGNHTVAGNPDRFRGGLVSIREDVAWQTALPTRDRLVVEAVTMPFLRRYGYSVHRS